MTKKTKKRRRPKPNLQRGKSAFPSVDALYGHLSSPAQKVTVFGAIQRIKDDNSRVLFSPNGQDWLAMPVDAILEAKGVRNPSDDLVHNVQLTLGQPGAKPGALFSHLTAIPSVAVTGRPPSPPTSPPPECGDKFPVWIHDHWECR